MPFIEHSRLLYVSLTFNYSPTTSKLSTINVLFAAPLNLSPSLLEEQTIANLYFFVAT